MSVSKVCSASLCRLYVARVTVKGPYTAINTKRSRGRYSPSIPRRISSARESLSCMTLIGEKLSAHKKDVYDARSIAQISVSAASVVCTRSRTERGAPAVLELPTYISGILRFCSSRPAIYYVKILRSC